MNANLSHVMTRTICALIFGAGLFLVSAADAPAHEIQYRPHIVHDHYVYSRTRLLPRWLRRNREFRHWYSHSRYRFAHHLTWHRVYDRYRFEQHYRWNNRKFHGKVYRDDGYRSYQKKWQKRKH
jgi:hypothetical protein